MKPATLLFFLILAVSGCTSSRVVPATNRILNDQNGVNGSSVDTHSPITVFLLERDIPATIQRLGIVLISPVAKGGKLDRVVKNELQKNCQQLGANGAFRLSEGYYPETGRIPYLVFRYELTDVKQSP